MSNNTNIKCPISNEVKSLYINDKKTHWTFIIDNLSFDIPRLGWEGQALVTLIIFVATALIVTSAAIAISVINVQSTSQFSQGQQSYDIAEAGAEDAILKLVRNSSFDSPSPGYNVTLNGSTATVIVTPPGQSATKTIVSRGVVHTFKRKLQVIGQFNADGTFSVVSWNEIDD